MEDTTNKPVEAVDERLYAGFLEVTQHAGCLSWFLTQNLPSHQR